MAVKLSTDIGPLWYHSFDGGVTAIVARDGFWEPQEGEVIRRTLKSGDAFMDVGAHVGYFSVMGAQIVGKDGSVISVEPEQSNCTLLARNLKPYTNCLMIEAACWTSKGFLDLHPSTVNSGDHRAYAHRESRDPQRVPAFPIDELGLQKLNLLKIDTQGADHKVVVGARETIQRCRPIIIVEWWPEGISGGGEFPPDVLKIYEDLGYDFEVIGGAELPTETGYCELLLTPRENK